MKQIALLGGSFNPPHTGHFEMAQYIHDTLHVDEVWFLFSENWQKDTLSYASAEHRMAMGTILSKHYPDKPFVMSGIQDELGTHKTYEVLTELSKRFPDDRFIWVMGADNLASFHTWEQYEEIITHFPIAVVDRPPYTNKALNSETARAFTALKKENPATLKNEKAGWAFLDNPKIDMSSSALLKELYAGRTQFNGPFQDVADYIRENKLYGLSNTNQLAEKKSISAPQPE